jgi:molybdopterin-binding protein
MNILKGIIENLKVNGSLTFVKVAVNNQNISAILIDTPSTEPFLKIGNEISVIFKETEVIIGKGNVTNISLQNKFFGKITNITSKNLLSKITINTTVGNISSIITTNAVNQLNLTENCEVTAMIKTNEIILSA